MSLELSDRPVSLFRLVLFEAAFPYGWYQFFLIPEKHVLYEIAGKMDGYYMHPKATYKDNGNEKSLFLSRCNIASSFMFYKTSDEEYFSEVYKPYVECALGKQDVICIPPKTDKTQCIQLIRCGISRTE